MILHAALLCLALNIHFEARGEPIEGQLAVAHVTINRAKENQTSICHEVFKKGQFSWTKKRYSIPKGLEWEKSKKIAQLSLKSPDSVNGATYFFNPTKCHPIDIVKKKKRVKKIRKSYFLCK
jgi:spore germination cell wall hydrolase CwlJ-like protein